MLPLNTTPVLRLSLAFAMAVLLDIFTHNMGLHTASVLPVAFLQTPLIRVLKMPREVDMSKRPNLKEQGLSWTLLYVGILVFIYHLIFFTLDAFSFGLIWRHFYIVLLNTVASLITIIAAMYFMRFRDK